MTTRFGQGSRFARRYDGDGNLLWSTEIAASTTGQFAGVVIHDAVGDGEGGIVGVGNQFIVGVGLSATTFRVDASGIELPRLTPVGTSVTEYYAIDRAPNGDYGVATTVGLPQGNPPEVTLFDGDLNLLWRRLMPLPPVGGQIRNIGFGEAGGLYVGVNLTPFPARIQRLSRTDGSTLWEVPLAPGEDSSRAFDHAPARGGGVFVSGSARSGPGTKGIVQRFSADGDPGPLGSSARVPVALAFLPEVGAVYCGPAVPNSAGRSAMVTAHGRREASAGALVLRAEGLPPGVATLFIVGSAQGSTPILGNGQGIICLGGLLGRYSSQVGFAGPGSVRELLIDLTATPTPAGPVPVTAGQTWNFHCWYRDSNPMPTSNATDAVAVTFI